MEEETLNSFKSLDKANHYRKWGGLISYLMKEVEGVRDLVNEELVRKRIPAQEFINILKMKFPDLADEKIPNADTVNSFKKKLGEDKDSKTMAIALKDEFKILRALNDFNLFEERMELYKKSNEVVLKARRALEKSLELMDKTGIPSSVVFESIGKLDSVLLSNSKHLTELDELAVRFGMMPPKQDKNILFAQHNITFTDEHEEMMKFLGLTSEDFDDVKYEETSKKILNYYATRTTKQEASSIRKAEVIDESGTVDEKGKEVDVGEELPTVGN